MSLLQTLSGVKQKSSHPLRHGGTPLATLPQGEVRQEEGQEVMFSQVLTLIAPIPVVTASSSPG